MKSVDTNGLFSLDAAFDLKHFAIILDRKFSMTALSEFFNLIALFSRGKWESNLCSL
jgi:hypothetical protein